MRFVKLGVIVIGISFFVSSCVTYKNIPYFQDLSDSARISSLKPKYTDLVIQPDDILSINIQTIDPAASAVFAQPVPSAYPTSNVFSATPTGATAANAQLAGASGYLINKKGDLDLPILGHFHLAGLTTSAAEDTIALRASLYYKSPTVYVRFSNFRITVLGEVERPGTFIMPNEKVTLFEALGLAGDLTIFGKRENVLLIRDSADHNQLVRLNLNSKEIVKSNYFYLQKNDVIYVEPIKAKLANVDAIKNRNYTIAAAILSVLIIASTRIK